MHRIAIFFAFLVISARGFIRAPPIHTQVQLRRNVKDKALFGFESTSILDTLLQHVQPKEATGEFILFFFGGSGALGIGGAQIPKILDQYNRIKALAGGQTKGGADLQINPIVTLGYPESLREEDVKDIINSLPSINDILARGKKKSYIAKLGYLERSAFAECLPQCNPLAVYAAFDALSRGSGSDVASPPEVLEMYEKWRSRGLDAFNEDLTVATLKKYSAFAVFAFLIILVLDLVAESARDAFFQGA